MGWSPGNTLERVEVTVPTFCPRRGTRPTLAQAASQTRRALARQRCQRSPGCECQLSTCHHHCLSYMNNAAHVLVGKQREALRVL